ncbi:MAG TPA: MFS transporter [Solirubrobacteraceae bacterium]|nr:MFS transporter [Solirubrobacteraceae bacterium]
MGSHDQTHAGISRRLVLLMAFACGASAANLYYAQPLLHTLGRAFAVSEGTAGLLVTITQLGYVIGLALLVPIGDLRERRGLISGSLLVTAAALAVAAAAPDLGVFAAAIAVVGLTSVVAQIIVPLSSVLSAEHERGTVVGTVMSGLLIGILTARTVSGLVAAALGWRAMFVIAAVAMLALSAVLRRALPRVPPATGLSYAALLRSVLTLVAEQPVLRLRMALGALTFGCFSALWTALAFLLAGPPFHYGNAIIGLFGLAGVVGAVAATAAGRLADRGHGALISTVTIVLLIASWAILVAGRNSALVLIAGIAVLDLAAQGLHISNQSAIYALDPAARSRLTTAYMVSYFLGGALFSALASVLYASGGWTAVCGLGAAAAVLALIVWSLAGTARARVPVPASATADSD